jgi:filamentous hemagglutinin family protein
MASRLTFYLALVAVCFFAAFVPPRSSAQNISIDGRFSPAQTLRAIGGNYSVDANFGKQVGSNLFHSFGKFGLSTGESATFSGPATISNVIGRITGGTQSNIDGQIRSTITGASLYLINPSGIVFGPNARSTSQAAFMECGRRNRQSRGSLDRQNAVISSDALGPFNILPRSTANANRVTVSAESLAIADSGQIASSSFGSGRAGNVSVDVTGSQPGALTIRTNGSVHASTSGAADAGSVFVRVAGDLTIDGTGTGAISLAQSFSANVGDGLTISAGSITVINVHQSAHSAPLSASLSNPLQAVRTRQPLPRSPSYVDVNDPLNTNVDTVKKILLPPLGPSKLRSRTELLGEACAPRSDRPISSLVEAGRSGLPQNPEATLPALYIAGQDVSPSATPGADAIEVEAAALQTAVHLTIRCGG